MSKRDELGEELYSMIAQLLNSKMNRTVLDSIRGEYGVLRYLLFVEDGVKAGTLIEKMQVVPGRMTDILKSLEYKGLVVRRKEETDKRIVRVFLTEAGRQEAEEKRHQIHLEYRGLIERLGEKDATEFIRLLKIVLEYPNSMDSFE
ncbi:MAG: MarR family transcriptional regulator [Lachnospiraceae bacterium]|nr:MarR family transcriptional regulator [Lachnospiraceae bacterium]